LGSSTHAQEEGRGFVFGGGVAVKDVPFVDIFDSFVYKLFNLGGGLGHLCLFL
jgi:hypothetical protein